MGFLLLACLALCAAPEDAWVEARPLAHEGIDEARLVAAAGPWVAYVRVLPIPEHLQRHHAPRHPWELVRSRDGVAGYEVLVASDSARSGWGAPTFLAVAPDGTVTAAWRPGHQVLVAPPGSPAVKHTVHDDGGLECVALTPTRLVVVRERTGALSARALTADGVGEPTALGSFDPRSWSEVVFGAPWLVWIDAAGELTAVDVQRAERRRVSLPAATSPVLDDVWNGRLLAHGLYAADGSGARLHVVDLETGAVASLSAPACVRVCVPEGAFTHDGRLWDPVDGQSYACERAPTDGPGALLRRAPGVLWLLASLGPYDWRELRLDAPRAPLAPRSPAPAPPPTTEPPAAWRAS